MNKPNLILGIMIMSIATLAFAATEDQTSNSAKEAKSVAWYVANIRESREKNKECYDNPELQSTEECKNSLHALKISYVGVGN